MGARLRDHRQHWALGLGSEMAVGASLAGFCRLVIFYEKF